jgi:folylpolyglutamate synthase/dihydrofolate synthase
MVAKRDNAAMTAPKTLADWLAYIEGQHPKAIDMGLERCREVARRMGLTAPARRVVTVGGTNGKGSTVAFVEAIARAAGWRVGAYTSPHLLRYNERVRIDGRDADDQALIAAFQAVEAARAGRDDAPVPLTYFEFGTLAALKLFAERDLDLAVLEVGLGGRLDAVNLVDADVAVVTTVDLDHQDWLGDTIEAIGFEKAGIARAWKPLILGDDDPPSSVLGHAYAIGASALRVGCDFFFEPDHDHPTRWHWRELGFALQLPMPALRAPVQLRNAAVAIAAVRALPGSEDWDEAASPKPGWRRDCSGSSAMAARFGSMSATTPRPRVRWRRPCARRRSPAAPMRCSRRWATKTWRAWSKPWRARSIPGASPAWAMPARAVCRCRPSPNACRAARPPTRRAPPT